MDRNSKSHPECIFATFLRFFTKIMTKRKVNLRLVMTKRKLTLRLVMIWLILMGLHYAY